ncbi:2-dehydro-3-deoxygalactonokinase [Feifania hominis]|uniref:2-dehydro-3-deoxygalactonokinase n=1 Tax=Feifania hominis TaxID=2763660 RepID=A0A926HQH8_9FIRM|nr:2-dehydro-3-deoxygalactonokinase [Feifania hominis]MBC8536357.1 2-dehydro-3-deoxygalactonokinase [Feifania hominis]
MSRYVITIDAGTTNTRVHLFDQDFALIASASRPVGVRNTAIDGNSEKLRAAVRDCVRELLEGAALTGAQLQCVLASGMITSNVGLYELPHVAAPAGVDELAAGAKSVLLEDVCPTPIWFIPGVKNFTTPVDTGNFERMDMMRGEEAECLPLIESHRGELPLLLVLPGSHTKFVGVGADGRISACVTSITGELLDVITKNTIIADAVGHGFVTAQSYDRDMVLLGRRTAERVGLGRACFAGRILSQFTQNDAEKIANFILGAVLQNDAAALLGSSALRAGRDATVVVTGKEPLRQAIADVLRDTGAFAQVREERPSDGAPLAALGARMVAQRLGLL